MNALRLQVQVLNSGEKASLALAKVTPDARAPAAALMQAREDTVQTLCDGGHTMQVRVLSGGEKARLALAKFMLTPGSLLVLDEPTNHLDIPSKEMLEDALTGFQGAVVAVSHDRYFLRKIATRIIAVSACHLLCA